MKQHRSTFFIFFLNTGQYSVVQYSTVHHSGRDGGENLIKGAELGTRRIHTSEPNRFKQFDHGLD